MVEQCVGGGPTPCVLPSHSTVPMGPHPLSNAGKCQGACGLASLPRPTRRIPTARPAHHAPVRPTGAAHTVHSGASMVHKAALTSRPANPTNFVLHNQVGYTGLRERKSRRDGRASQEASHRREVRTWDRPQSYHTRSWAVKYLDQCRGQPPQTGTTSGIPDGLSSFR